MEGGGRGDIGEGRGDIRGEEEREREGEGEGDLEGTGVLGLDEGEGVLE